VGTDTGILLQPVSSFDFRGKPKETFVRVNAEQVIHCPRPFYLELVLYEFSEGVDTLEGESAHRNVQELDVTEAGDRIHS
jgi:hypothetical protein